jgi:SNF2 family DNA or RNA helicase
VFFDDPDADELEANGEDVEGSEEEDMHQHGTVSWSSPPNRGRRETEAETVEVNRVMTRVYDDMQTYLENIPQAPQPPELVTPLMDHQKQALHWLCAQEDKGTLRCGILADDMGVGKTIETLGLLCARHRDRTLIVCPMTMLQHWRNEIEKHIYPNTFRVLTYYGTQRPKSLDELERAHIVLTTYGTLVAEYKKLTKVGVSPETFALGQPLPAVFVNQGTRRCFLYSIPWDRVILDEAQYVKNRSSISSKAACAISGGFRFALTGTPISNTLDDLFSLLVFIRFPDYPEYKEWRVGITKPIAEHNSMGYKRLAELLRRCMLRRRKEQKLKGKPIVELPAVTSNSIQLDFDAEDQLFYFATEHSINMQFESMAKFGQRYVMQHYSHVLVLLLRLRQAACHPYLVSMANVYSDEEANALAQGRGAWNFDLLEDFTKQMIAKLKEVRRDIVEKVREEGQQELSELEIMQRITQQVAMSFVTNTEGAPCLKCARSAEDPVITPCSHIFCRRCIPEDRFCECPKCDTGFNNEKGLGVEPATPAQLRIAAELAKDPHRTKADPFLVKADPGSLRSSSGALVVPLTKAHTYGGKDSSAAKQWKFMPAPQFGVPKVLDIIDLDEDREDILAPLKRPTSVANPIDLDEDGEDILGPPTFPRSQSAALPTPQKMASPLQSPPFTSKRDPGFATPVATPPPQMGVGFATPGPTPSPKVEAGMTSTVSPSAASASMATDLSAKMEEDTTPTTGRPMRRTRLSPIPRQAATPTKNLVISRTKLNEPTLFQPSISGAPSESPLSAIPSPKTAGRAKRTRAKKNASIKAVEPSEAESGPMNDDFNEERTLVDSPAPSATPPVEVPLERQRTTILDSTAMLVTPSENAMDTDNMRADNQLDDDEIEVVNDPLASRASSGFFQQGVTRLDTPPKSYIMPVDRTIDAALMNLAAVKPINHRRRGRDGDVDDLEESEERSKDDEDDGSDLDDFIVDDDAMEVDGVTSPTQKKRRRSKVNNEDDANDSDYEQPSKPKRKKKRTKAQFWEEENKVRPQDLVQNFGRFAPLPQFEVHVPANIHLTGAAARRAMANYQLKRHSTKLTALLSALELIKASKSDDKIVIYSQFTRYLDVIEAPLRQWGWKMLRLDGKMTQQARASTLNSFDRDPECRILIVSIKAGGVGINLTVANHIFLMDPWWNTAVEKQAIDRVHRIGQKKAIFVTRFFVKQTVEQRILAIQGAKDKIIDRALSNTRGDVAPRKGLTFNELRQLFTSSFNQNDSIPEPLIFRGPEEEQVHFMPARIGTNESPLPPAISAPPTPMDIPAQPIASETSSDPASPIAVKPERRTRPVRATRQTQPLDPFRPL